MTRARRAALLAALVVAALVPRLYHVRSPFMTFADHNTANFSIFARNYLEHGYLATRFGQVRTIGPAGPHDLTFFAHHPPTIALLTSLAFRALGVTEWAARLMPLVLSALTCPVLFVLSSRMAGAGAGTVAALLFAFAPGAVYYGQMLDHEAFVTFFGLLAIAAWLRHEGTGSIAAWRACLGLVVVTTLIDWPGAYLAPALAIASWIAPATRARSLGMAAALVASAGGALAAVGLHILAISGSFQDLLASLSLRVLSSPQLPFTWGEYLYRIRINLEYALTPPIAWMAAAGVALLAARLVWRRTVGEAGALAAAVAVFCGAHHVVFTNACHYNEHLVYYLLPLATLGAVMLPASLGEIAAAVSPVAGAAVSVLAAAAPMALFLSQAPAQTRSYFNDVSVPGWPLLGQALHDAVPEGGVLLTHGEIASPQMLHYLGRERYNGVAAGDLPESGRRGAWFLADRNDDLGEGLRARLAPFPAGPILNFELRDLTSGAKAPDTGPLRPPDAEWRPVEVRFGDAIELTMIAFAAPPRPAARVPALAEYLGVPWTPALAAGRVVHASFVWERLDARAAALAPEYALVERVSGARAPLMWPLAAPASDLAPLPTGAIARHEIDWFLGEWLPAGTYDLEVGVRDGKKSLAASGTTAFGSVTIHD
ncbi:MAG: glycosyltransferase family 39 protein [Acidobacteria bacterium]|nr:glycosyltransferase family 39 protein [Acidobacteriota bacterium]